MTKYNRNYSVVCLNPNANLVLLISETQYTSAYKQKWNFVDKNSTWRLVVSLPKFYELSYTSLSKMTFIRPSHLFQTMFIVQKHIKLYIESKIKVKNCWKRNVQAREFKANPMRDLTPVLPRKRTQAPTKPVPFELEVDVRGAVKAEEFKKQVHSQTYQYCSV